MAFYYVKNGGSATGDGGRNATKQTGTFAALGASNYYATIELAIAATTPPTAGDLVLVSDLHNSTSTTNTSYTGVIVNTFSVFCVDDTDITAPRRSGNRAFESPAQDNNKDISINNMSFSGIKMLSGDNMTCSNQSSFDDCYIEATGSGDFIFLVGNDRCSIVIRSSEIVMHNNSSMQMSNAVLFDVRDTTFSSTAGTSAIDELFSGNFGLGGATVYMRDCDLSEVTVILDGVGSSTAQDTVSLHFDNCKTKAGVVFTNTDFSYPAQRALFTRCGATDAVMEYQYHLHAFGGDVSDDTSEFRNEDTAFTLSNQKVSYEIATDANANINMPLYFDFPISRFSELSSTSTLEFYITSSGTLTNKDFYINVSYPDGTNYTTAKKVSSATSTVGGSLDLITDGTTLTTDGTSTWNVGQGNNYKIEIDCPSGADCQPTITVNVTKPSTTLYLASDYGLS